MPVWKPGCLRSSSSEPEAIQYRPATNGYPLPADDISGDRRGTAIVDLHKKEGCGLGLIIAGGVDKTVRPHITNLRPGGIAHRSDCLEVGDILLSVNGIRTSAMRHDEIISLLKNADENVRLEVEYELPECGPTDTFSVRCKQHTIALDADCSTFGFTIRGGSCPNRIKCRPLTVTQIRPGGPADRESSLKVGDRILAINEFSVVTLNLAEVYMLLSQCDNLTAFTMEYDISVIDAVQKATGPLLIELDKTPGAVLGISLSHARHKGKHCVCIDSIRPMSIADRCGALHIGDHILSIDGAEVEHMTVAEATQLLKSTSGDQIKMEILPVRLAEQKGFRDSGIHNTAFQQHMIPSVSSPILTSLPLSNGFAPSKSYQMLASSNPMRKSTEMIARRHRSWTKSDRKLVSSCASVSSVGTSVFTSSNQVCRMDTMETMLYGEPSGLGIVLDAAVFATTILDEPPIVTRVEPHSAAERSGVIQEGDRILTINGQDVCEKTLDEINQVLQDSWQRIKLEVEFDVADSVMASSGTYVVKLPRKPGGIGITLSAKSKLGTPLMITEVKKGSIAHRCGSVQPGDKLLCINDIRTENLSIDEAVTLLKGDDEIIKLKLKRDDPCTDEHGDECISYTVELQRQGGPLGITISGTDEPADPIIISAMADGGLCAKTGAIHVGDRLLAINGVSTIGKSLTDATKLLQMAGDLVTLRVARPDRTIPRHDTHPKTIEAESERQNLCKSTTPVRSIDSALESWDSSGGQEANGTSNHGNSKQRPQSATLPKYNQSHRKRGRPYSSDSTDTDDFSKKLNDLRISDEAWDGDMESSHSDSSPEDQENWSKAFKNFEVQSDMLQQMAEALRLQSTGSLDRKNVSSLGTKKDRQRVKRNWSHSTSRGAVSQSDLRPYSSGRKQRRCASTSSATRDSGKQRFHDQLKIVFAPEPIQLHRVTLVKDCLAEDFGFGVSDGVYDKGVYISAVRTGSVADRMGLKQFDRILKINKKKTRDYHCSLAIPLISEAGNTLDIVVCRNPLAAHKTVLKQSKQHKPLPVDPPDNVTLDSQESSVGQIYVNVCNLDTPITRSEKSCKTV